MLLSADWAQRLINHVLGLLDRPSDNHTCDNFAARPLRSSMDEHHVVTPGVQELVKVSHGRKAGRPCDRKTDPSLRCARITNNTTPLNTLQLLRYAMMKMYKTCNPTVQLSRVMHACSRSWPALITASTRLLPSAVCSILFWLFLCLLLLCFI